MRISTRQLEGHALDWAVATAEGLKAEPWHAGRITVLFPNAPRPVPFAPSTSWAQGGPILDREIDDLFRTGAQWVAYIREPDNEPWQENGATALVAAMRCYVASKLGDAIEVPDELDHKNGACPVRG